MDAVRKAAILLLSLEKPIAAEVLSQLPKNLVESVTLEIAKIDDITKDQVEAVLREFRGMARERVPIERGGIEFANDLLKQSLGTEGAGEILENVRNSMNSVPFGFLHKMGAENILTFIIEEHPQTIALIMSHLPTNMAAEVLSGLPSNKQIEVIRRVANMEQTNPEVVKDVEASLERRMKSMFNQQLEKAGGVRLVAADPQRHGPHDEQGRAGKPRTGRRRPGRRDQAADVRVRRPAQARRQGHPGRAQRSRQQPVGDRSQGRVRRAQTEDPGQPVRTGRRAAQGRNAIRRPAARQ